MEYNLVYFRRFRVSSTDLDLCQETWIQRRADVAHVLCCDVMRGVGLVRLVPGFTKAPGTVGHRAESHTELIIIISFLNTVGLNVSSSLKNKHTLAPAKQLCFKKAHFGSWTIWVWNHGLSECVVLIICLWSSSCCVYLPPPLCFWLIREVRAKPNTLRQTEKTRRHARTHAQAQGGVLHCILPET